MPNKEYLKGVRKERKLVNEARAKGLLAFRSAGSHSPIDVFILDRFSQTIKLIQCKPDDMSSNAKKKLLETLEKFNGEFMVKVSVE